MMLQIRRILVPTDVSPNARYAAGVAADMARRVGAEIHLLSVYETARANPIQAMFQAPPSGREVLFERLSEERARLETAGVVVREVRRDGADVSAEILMYADEVKCDVIVIGRHSQGILGRLKIGGTADEVVRRSECAVMVVRGADDRGADTSPFKHILTPVDFSDDAERVVPAARALAALYGASLSLLYVAESRVVPVFSDTGLFTVNTVEPDDEVDDRASRALEQLVREGPGPDVETSYHVRRGHAAREILDYARDQGVDLIMLAAHGIGAHGLFGMGSVAERVIGRSAVPVLTVKPMTNALVE